MVSLIMLNVVMQNVVAHKVVFRITKTVLAATVQILIKNK
jgi:hypothetical protein